MMRLLLFVSASPVVRAPRLKSAARRVVSLCGADQVCPTCRMHGTAHRDTTGRYVGCNVARVRLLDGVRGRMTRCAPVQPFAVDVEAQAR